jgi:ferredoxin
MKVAVDPESCIASGLCIVTEPRVFDQDESTGAVRLLSDEPPADALEAVREAARMCPARAITVVGDQAG